MLKNHKTDVLYINPQRNPASYNIPMGLIGLMNSINCVKSGKMYFEVTDDIISNSKIIVMDCYWYFSLSEIARLAKEFKKINPTATIIVGGDTATIFSKMIVDRFKVDYVIKGDAEIPFPLLINALLDNRNIRGIPNIVNRCFITPQSYKLTKEDYSKTNCITIDWFTTFSNTIKMIHNEFPFHWSENLGLYPFIPVFKGCNYDCKFCYASKSLHRAICKRGLVSRTAESVIGDLQLCSKQKNITQIYMIADFIGILGHKFADKIFAQKYDINLHYTFDFANSPPIKMLEKVIFSFRKCDLYFIFSEYFHRDSAMRRYNYLAETFDYLRRYDDKIKLNLFMLENNKTFGKLYRKLAQIYKGLNFIDHRAWFMDIPYPNNSYTRDTKKYFDVWLKKSGRYMSMFPKKKSNKYHRCGFYQYLAKQYKIEKKYNKALHYYKKALKLDSNNSFIYSELARIHFILKRYKVATKEAIKAAKLNHKEINIHLVLGFCYEKVKRFAEAIKEFSKVKEGNSKNTQINLSLYNCYKNIKQMKRANTELNKWLFKRRIK